MAKKSEHKQQKYYKKSNKDFFKMANIKKNLKKKKIAVRIQHTHKCKVLTRVCTKSHICVNSYYFRDLLVQYLFQGSVHYFTLHYYYVQTPSRQQTFLDLSV